METQLSLHLKKFNDRVKVMNQTNAKELILSALEARNLHNDIFELLTQNRVEEVIEVGMDGGGF